MDSIGASNTPVVLGDFSYWATRLVIDDAHVQVYREAPGLIENGNIGLGTFARADGELLYTDTNSPSPFVTIRNHS
jgi:predicted phage gp36 major capsid-like protein